MTTVISRHGISGDINRDIKKLEALATDLRRLADGYRPSAQDLESAPLIGRWKLGNRSDTCLLGDMTDHPILGTREGCYTSSLWVIATDLGWARTFSRFYRLGQRSVDGRLQ